MASPTWGTIERPILEAINDGATASGGPRWEDIVAATGLPEDRVQVALRRLFANGWIDGIDVTTMSGGFQILNLTLLEPALSEIGVWPTDAYTELLGSLGERIDAERDPIALSKLERLRGAILEVGQTVATAVLKDALERAAGMHP
jgi:hypothetical protein